MPIIHSPVTQPATNPLIVETTEDGGITERPHERTRSMSVRSHSSRGSQAGIQARKASATAVHLRRQLEREQELVQREREREQREREREQREREREKCEREREQRLAKLQQQVEEQELEAELASIEDEGSVSGHRTNKWVSDVSRGILECDPIAPLSRQVTKPPPPTTCVPTPPLEGPAYVSTTSNSVLLQAVADTAAAAKALASNQNNKTKPDLFPFYGDTLQWLQFKRIYCATKQSFSPLENVLRLQNALSGPARDAVAPLLVAGEDPDEIVRALEENFARPEFMVFGEVAALKNLPKLGNDLKELGTIANRVRSSLVTIKLLNQTEYLFSPELFHAILGKLNPIIKLRWTDFAMKDCSERPKLEILSEFLKQELDQHIRFGLSPDSFTSKPDSTSNKQSVSFNIKPSVSFNKNVKHENIHVDMGDKNKTLKTKEAECVYCKKGHNIKFCSAFKILSVDDRWHWLKESKVCYKCLKGNRHLWKSCKTPACGEDGCRLHHHPLLHRKEISQSEAGASTTLVTETSEPVSQNLELTNPSDNKTEFSNTLRQLQQTESKCLNSKAFLKIVPVTVSGPLGSRNIYALLDDGSTATLIESSIAAAIGATGPTQTITINGIGGLSTVKTVSYVNFNIKGRYTSETYMIKNVRSMSGLCLCSQTLSKESIVSYSHLNDLIDTLTYEVATPSMLIGSEHWYLLYSHETRIGKRNQPVACRTALGWTLYGVVSSKAKLVEFVNHGTFSNKLSFHENDLDLLIKEHYSLDSIGISKFETIHSKQDLRAIEILNSTAKRLSSGRFEVGLPWRDDIQDVPDSFPQALSRFYNLERRMRQDTDFSQAYTNFIDNMLHKNYAEGCPIETYHDKHIIDKKVSSVRFYLPHFGVYHPQKRKLRVVLDAAAKSNGVNLNSLLIPGPDLLQSLLGILFRFREGRVAMSADIKEMFSQIQVRKEDRDALRFLWRPVCTPTSNTKSYIKEYRMSSVIFGASCSPFIAQHVKNLNAKQHENKYPEAAKAILNDHYMDDFIGSIDTTAEAAQLAADIITVHKAACMEMRGWVSNDQAALELVSPDLRAQQSSDVRLGSSNIGFVKVLGVKWSPDLDYLGFRSAGDSFPCTLTKRVVLSHLMRVYDPLGLLTPVIIKGRILFQEIWRSGIAWDTQLSSSDHEKWVAWFQEVTEAAALKVPRWYASTENCEPLERELHVFADSSEHAFACVAFWRFIYKNGIYRVVLISSKARVAPIKPISIPRLELQAALIASRLAVTIRNSHRKKPHRVYYWTDSMIVLGWLRSDARTFKPFVAHRLGEILENTSVKDWHWVPSDLNVADDATRVRPIFLNENHRWFLGPYFLSKPSNEWPLMPKSVPLASEELKGQPRELVAPTTVVELPSPVTANFQNFSNWLRLVRATARIHQAAAIFGKILENIRNPITNRDNRFRTHHLQSASTTLPPLDARQMKTAEEHIFQRLQLESFPEEFSSLLNAKPISRRSRLLKLSPILGPDKLLRLAGRIGAVEDVDPDTRCPILLDGRHPTVLLLVQHYHKRAGHANHHTVINEIRQRFWLIGLRNAVRTTVSKCLLCRIKKSRPMIPPTGNLPHQRLAHHQRPFTFTGLDYFGPITVTIGRRHEKRYVALFTCLTIRAIHLEVVHSLSADSAILSLRRFFARRGIPHTIFSDNGTAFVGANRILREFFSNGVRDFAATKSVNWSFIPPAAPTFGGCWERLVRSVKVALSAVLRERSPKEEVLLTLLLEAEAVVNSRPLSHVATDPESPTTLTPFHFLIGTSSNEVLPKLDDGVFSGRADFKKALHMADQFWNRWVREILPDLQPREPTSGVANLKLGDIVIIADESLPRNTWPKGKIIKLFPGQDGVIRVVDVETRGGILRRPVRKLIKILTER